MPAIDWGQRGSVASMFAELDLDLLTAVLLVAGGFIAGFINAVAGGGSAITLPILNELLGASVANGTNRIAILLQNVSGVTRFQRSGKVPWAAMRPLFLPIMIGAVTGAWLATGLDDAAMERVFGVVVLLVALSVIVKLSEDASLPSMTSVSPAPRDAV